MHRSLKAFLQKRPNGVKQILGEQQAVFDNFRQEYHHIRSLEGLNHQRPAELYRPSHRQYSGKIEPYQYEAHQQTRHVK